MRLLRNALDIKSNQYESLLIKKILLFLFCSRRAAVFLEAVRFVRMLFAGDLSRASLVYFGKG